MPRSFTAAGLSAVCVLLAVSLRASDQLQTPQTPQPAGVILGIVHDAHGAPVEGALVTLRGGFQEIGIQAIAADIRGGNRSTLTRADGRFLFGDLPKGSYSLEASKSGYLAGAFGRRRPGGAAQSIVLEDGARHTTVRVQMWEFATVEGAVLDEAGEPLVNMPVFAMRSTIEAGYSKLENPPVTGRTDDRGLFRIDGLVPGTYVVCTWNTSVTTPTDILARFEQARAAGQQAMVALMQEISGANVNPAQPGIPFGASMFQQGRPGTAPSTFVPSSDGQVYAYPPSCHPGTGLAGAERVTLASGETRPGITFELKPVRTAEFSGRLVGPEGPVPHTPIRLTSPEAALLTGESGFESGTTLSDATGAFRFIGVPVGEYVLEATKLSIPRPGTAAGSPDPSTPGYWAQMPVSLSEKGLHGVDVMLQRGFRVTGQVVFDGSLPKATPEMMARYGIQFSKAEGQGARQSPGFVGRVDQQGRITSPELPPGKYVVLFLAAQADRLAMPGWVTEGATLHGRDVSNQPLDLRTDETDLVMTLTDRPAALAGTARNTQGQPDADAAVLFFPASPRQWRDYGYSSRTMRQARTDESGGYRVVGFPAGDYFVAAVPEADAVGWQDPAILAELAKSATRVTVGRHEQRTADPVTQPLPRGGR